MKKKLYIPLIAVLFAACTSSKYTVNTYIPEKTDYSKYKTFAYADMAANLSEEMTKQLSALLQAQAAITNEMARRGFTLVQRTASPDLIVNIGTLLENRKDVQVSGVVVYPERDMMYWGAVDYDLRYDPEIYQTVIKVKEYKEGSVLLDIIDAKKKVLLWHGVVSQALLPSNQPEEDPVQKAITVLFEKFPVKPVK